MADGDVEIISVDEARRELGAVLDTVARMPADPWLPELAKFVHGVDIQPGESFPLERVTHAYRGRKQNGATCWCFVCEPAGPSLEFWTRGSTLGDVAVWSGMHTPEGSG